VTGRGRTCDAPRFKRALYRLSYGHVNQMNEWAEPESNRRPPHQRGALPAELSAGDLRTHACLSSAPDGELDAHAEASPRFDRCSPTTLSMPLTYPSTLDRRPGARRPTWRGVGARCSRCVTVNGHAEVTRTHTRGGRTGRGDLSLSGGTSIGTGTSQAGHHLLVVVVDCLASRNKKGDPSGSPLPAVVFCARDLACTPRGKGESAAVLALQIEAMPARHDRHGGCRFGDGVRCVDGVRHGVTSWCSA
jgi:hypothetical protein